MDFSFFPDRARAKALDHCMRSHLGESLAYLDAASTEQRGEAIKGLAQVVAQMRAGALYSPSAFGIYYEATMALMAQNESSAYALFEELRQQQPMLDIEARIITLDQVTPASARERYQRLMDTDPTTAFRILPPAGDLAALAVRSLESGLQRLRCCLPTFAGEFDALVRQVILVVGDESLSYDFAGGSCYMLWGALFINAGSHTNDIAVMEAIVHEASHSLLFGFTIDEALVLNNDEELYTSPLREDPRPMDGIFHATYVSARTHYAVSKLLQSDSLTSDERHLCARRLEAILQGFWQGYRTVLAYGRLSPTGQALMTNTHNYMRAFPDPCQSRQ